MNQWMKGKFTPTNPTKYVGDVGDIVYRSSWERTFMAWCDTTPEVVKWSSETTVIGYIDPVQKKQRRYFVDFKMLVRKADGTNKVCLVEIKPHKQTMRPRSSRNKSEKTMMTEMSTWLTNQAKWNAAREVCRQKNWEFIVLTERELFGGIDRGFKSKKK